MGLGPWTKPEDKARIRGALKMGLTQSETARLLGVSRDRVRRVALTAGIPARVAPGANKGAHEHVCSCGRPVRGHWPKGDE